VLQRWIESTQFTSAEFTGVLKTHGIVISMDGKGRWVDNAFIERLWRSVKYEHVYLHAHETVAAARAGVSDYLEFYNSRRPNTALGGRTPDTAYFTQQPMKKAA